MVFDFPQGFMELLYSIIKVLIRYASKDFKFPLSGEGLFISFCSYTESSSPIQRNLLISDLGWFADKEYSSILRDDGALPLLTSE